MDVNPTTGLGNVVSDIIVGIAVLELLVGEIDTVYNTPEIKLLNVIVVNTVEDDVNAIIGDGSIV